VDDTGLRKIAILGLMATVALAVMMMFSLSQITDTQTPQIAVDIARDLAAAFAPGPPAPVRLTMSREGKGLEAARTYKLVVRPNEKVAADDRSLARLMQRASECCAAELGDVKCDVTIRCVAELPDGGVQEASFVKDKGKDPFGFGSVHPVGAASAPASSTPAPAAPAAPVPTAPTAPAPPPGPAQR
jgi:hypothetical protein